MGLISIGFSTASSSARDKAVELKFQTPEFVCVCRRCLTAVITSRKEPLLNEIVFFVEQELPEKR